MLVGSIDSTGHLSRRFKLCSLKHFFVAQEKKRKHRNGRRALEDKTAGLLAAVYDRGIVGVTSKPSLLVEITPNVTRNFVISAKPLFITLNYRGTIRLSIVLQILIQGTLQDGSALHELRKHFISGIGSLQPAWY